jgi:hypothetical protein
MPKKPLSRYEACQDMTYHELRCLVAGLAAGLDRFTDRTTADRFGKELGEWLVKDQSVYPPIRRDCTDRECAGILGGLVGVLVQFAPVAEIRNALAWWAETDEPWEELAQLRQIGAAALGKVAIDAERDQKGSGN